MGFRLVLTSVILNDPERRNDRRREVTKAQTARFSTLESAENNLTQENVTKCLCAFVRLFRALSSVKNCGLRFRNSSWNPTRAISAVAELLVICIQWSLPSSTTTTPRRRRSHVIVSNLYDFTATRWRNLAYILVLLRNVFIGCRQS